MYASTLFSWRMTLMVGALLLGHVLAELSESSRGFLAQLSEGEINAWCGDADVDLSNTTFAQIVPESNAEVEELWLYLGDLCSSARGAGAAEEESDSTSTEMGVLAPGDLEEPQATGAALEKRGDWQDRICIMTCITDMGPISRCPRVDVPGGSWTLDSCRCWDYSWWEVCRRCVYARCRRDNGRMLNFLNGILVHGCRYCTVRPTPRFPPGTPPKVPLALQAAETAPAVAPAGTEPPGYTITPVCGRPLPKSTKS